MRVSMGGERGLAMRHKGSVKKDGAMIASLVTVDITEQTGFVSGVPAGRLKIGKLYDIILDTGKTVHVLTKAPEAGSPSPDAIPFTVIA
jgi:hypothetical protein